MKSDDFFTVVLAVLGACALVTTALLVRREFSTPASAVQALPTVPVSGIVRDWPRYATGAHRNGTPGAPVTIVEFADYQCPYCGQLQATLGSLHAKYAGRIAVVFHHFPLTEIPPAAFSAAPAAECAADQGRFDPMHRALFAEQDSIGRWPRARFAEQAGIADVPRFTDCLRKAEDSAAIEADIALGNRLGVRGTPTLLVDSLRLDGNPVPQVLDSIVQALLAPSR
jgi:protein-disulfide isomerase